MRADQFLDTRGRLIEAFGKPRDFVAAFDFGAGAEIAGSECFDRGLAAARSAASARAQPDRRRAATASAINPRNNYQPQRRMPTREMRTNDQPALVRQLEFPDRTAGTRESSRHHRRVGAARAGGRRSAIGA